MPLFIFLASCICIFVICREFSVPPTQLPTIGMPTLTNATYNMLASCASISYVNVMRWTYNDYCTYYSNNECPQIVIEQYSDTANYPSCPPSCASEIIPSSYCELYSALLYTCVNSTVNIAVLQQQCIDAYAATVTTVTDVSITPGVVLSGTTAAELQADPVAQLALKQSMADSAGVKVKNVNITDISASTTSQLRRFVTLKKTQTNRQMADGASVTFLIKVAAESVGYSSNTASSLVTSITEKLTTAVTSGDFFTKVQQNIGDAYIPSLANANVDVVASNAVLQSSAATASVEFVVTGAPSTSPTSSPSVDPTLSPSAGPTSASFPTGGGQVVAAASGASASNTNEVGVGVGSAVGVLVFILLVFGGVYLYRRRQKQKEQKDEELNVDELTNIKTATNML